MFYKGQRAFEGSFIGAYRVEGFRVLGIRVLGF